VPVFAFTVDREREDEIRRGTLAALHEGTTRAPLAPSRVVTVIDAGRIINPLAARNRSRAPS